MNSGLMKTGVPPNRIPLKSYHYRP